MRFVLAVGAFVLAWLFLNFFLAVGSALWWAVGVAIVVFFLFRPVRRV